MSGLRGIVDGLAPLTTSVHREAEKESDRDEDAAWLRKAWQQTRLH